MILLSQKSLSLACLVFTIPHVHGAFVAAHYANGASADSAALKNLAPITPGLIVSDLTTKGFDGTTDSSLITRTEFTADIPSSTTPEQDWLYSNASDINTARSSSDDFFRFSVTNNTTNTFSSGVFTFDAISVVRSGEGGDGGTGGLITSWQLYVSTDGGTNFTLLDPKFTATVRKGTKGYSPLVQGNINLASLIAPIPSGGTYVFRLALEDNSTSSVNKASFTQNIKLNGAFIPEPSRPIFLLLSVLLVTWRRAR